MEDLKKIVTWLANLLTSLVEGIQDTFKYWTNREDELKDLTKE